MSWLIWRYTGINRGRRTGPAKQTRIRKNVAWLSVFLALLGVLLLPAVPGPIGPATLAAEGTPPDQVLVKFREGVSPAERQDTHAQKGGKVASVIPGIDVDVVAVPQGNGAEKARAYEEHPGVLYAEVDGQAHATDAPNDPYFVNATQWGLMKVQAPQAWDIKTGSSTISIAVLDTGIDSTHPDLAGKVTSSKNFSASSTVSDLYGHGTHVAGIAAAATNNGVGIAGLGYSSTLLNVKVLGDNGSGSYSAVANGVIWAADNGAKVINMSLGGPSASSTLESAVNYAWTKGVLVVAAAGNNGNSIPFYPAYYQNAIAVAATSGLDQLAGFSNRGDWVDVGAPGASIWSTVPVGSCPLCDPLGYKYLSGTSMASPHVAGLAALVFTQVTDVNSVRARIQDNADNIGVSGIGSGRINACRAVLCSTVIPPPDTTAPTVSIASPTNGATVSNTISIDATATDNVGVTKVDFYLNGTLYDTDTATPYSVIWSTLTATNASHTLTAKAYDAANNVGTSSSVSITVDNAPPIVSLASPSSGSTAVGTITIQASASDNIGIFQVDFYRDSDMVLGTSLTFPYAISWDSARVPNGTHTLYAKAIDLAANITTSSSVTITTTNNVVDTIPLTVSITSPLDKATVARRSTITISATANDYIGVTKVEFSINGQLQCTDFTTPYICDWNVPGKPNATYQLTAKASDGANNTASSVVQVIAK